jgi:hypothetical protein
MDVGIPRIMTVPAGTNEAIFWGMGADGTIGGVRNAAAAITGGTDLCVPLDFALFGFASYLGSF